MIIYEQMDNQHRSKRGGELPEFDVLATSSQRNHSRRDIVAEGHQVVFGRKDGLLGPLDVLDVEQLDLSNHDGVIVLRGKSSIREATLGHVGCSGHHA